MAEFSLIGTSGLSKPATILIEKISNAFGRHFDPSQTIRMALAEAKANRIRAVSEAETEIEVEELRSRAANRVLNEEITIQENMENITRKAIPDLTDKASPEKIEDDWITNFFDKCRIVSDNEMQELWARVLAGQGNNPGSFSRKTVNLVADLDKRDAGLFTRLCRFMWIVRNEPYPFVFDIEHEIYGRCGISFRSLDRLEALGLVRFDDLSGFRILNLPKKVTTFYGNRQVQLTLSKDSENELGVGKVLLTQSGSELFRIAKASIVEGFFDYVYGRWASDSLVPPPEPQEAAQVAHPP